jgi:hypothetical protein
MEISDLSHDSASNAEVIGWAAASPQVIARVLNTALVAQDLSGFAALLSDIARDRGLKGRAARTSRSTTCPTPACCHGRSICWRTRSTCSCGLASSCARGGEPDDLSDDDDLAPLRDMDDDDVIDDEDGHA